MQITHTKVALNISDPNQLVDGPAWNADHAVSGAPWFAPSDYGAVGDGVVDDTVAIQDAIDAAAVSGGMVWLDGTAYLITSPLTIQAPATVGLWIRGQAAGATTITQATAGTDVFQLGATGAQVADYIHVSDLTISGGRYGLNLNNALAGCFERLVIENATTGIYCQGQNERHVFRDIDINGCTEHGFYGAATNGGTGSVLDLPECQKLVFDHLRISGTTSGTAFVMTAGVLGSQQVSGFSEIRNVRLESNQQTEMAFSWCASVTLEDVSNESALNAHNVYDALLVDSLSSVYGSHLQFSQSSTANKFRSLVNVASGHLTLATSNVSVVTACGTADVWVTDNLTLVDSYLYDATRLTFATTAAERNSLLIGNRDASGQFLTATEYFGSNTTYLGQRTVDATAISFYGVNAAASLAENDGIHFMQNGTVGAGINLGLATNTAADFGGGAHVFAIRKTTFPPTTTPTNAGILYVANDGSLHYKGSSGTDTTIGPA